MAQKDLRTYHRRGVTRESGYHTCDETTGGECLVRRAERYVCNSDTVTFVFSRSSVEVVELFEKGISILAFGGYVHSSKKATISLDMSFSYEGDGYAFGDGWEQTIEANNWSNIGIHAEQLINKDSLIIDATVKNDHIKPAG